MRVKKDRVAVTFPPDDEDRKFLAEAAQSIGCDEATYLRMTIRQQRMGNLPALEFGMGATHTARPRRQAHHAQQYEAELPLDGEDVTMPDEARVDDMVAARLAEAEGSGALDIQAQPEMFQQPASSVVPLVMNKKRGYLLGSTSAGGG